MDKTKFLVLSAAYSALVFSGEALADNHPIEHKINSLTVVTSPNNRDRKKVGVGEDVFLELDPGHNATWTISGKGKINGDVKPVKGTSAVMFTAPDTTPMTTAATPTTAPVYGVETTTITATCEKDGGAASITFTTVRPSGLKFVFDKWNSFIPGPMYSFDFDAKVYVLPADVNFEKIKIQEDTCTAVLSGFYSQYANDPNAAAFLNHPQGALQSLTRHVNGVGTPMAASDHISHTPSIAPPYPYSNGTYTLNIPTLYELNGKKGEFAKGVFVAKIAVSSNPKKVTLSGDKNGPLVTVWGDDSGNTGHTPP